MLVLEDEQRSHGKYDYYLAQIAFEIRRVQEMFAKSPKPVRAEDYLIRYRQEEGREVPRPPAIEREEEEEPTTEKEEQTQRRRTEPIIDVSNREPIEVGPEAMKDPKWAEVNRRAKAVWAARLGLERLE